MDGAALQQWETFALVVGSAAGALVGLLFVAISIRAAAIAASAAQQSGSDTGPTHRPSEAITIVLQPRP
jgi:hypothetical protein